MLSRRGAMIRMGAAWTSVLAQTQWAAGSPQAAKQRPLIDRPLLFNTPQADQLLAQLQVFPPDNAWNVDISAWPVHENSQAIIASIGANSPLRYNTDMAFALVPPNQPKVPVRIEGYADESDRGPFPVPDNMPIEGWPAEYKRNPKTETLTLDDMQRDRRNMDGDRHAIVVDPMNRMLYEFYAAKKTNSGWTARQASVFDLKTNRMRPEGWTSTDAAGLPIFPAIVRFDELERGTIRHALRVTVKRSRRAYVYPARHFASRSNDANLPRMGERIRLKRDFDTSGFTPPVRTILEALKRHGMLVADNGIDWAISVAPDERIPVLHEELRKVRGSAFEVVERPQK